MSALVTLTTSAMTCEEQQVSWMLMMEVLAFLLPACARTCCCWTNTRVACPARTSCFWTVLRNSGRADVICRESPIIWLSCITHSAGIGLASVPSQTYSTTCCPASRLSIPRTCSTWRHQQQVTPATGQQHTRRLLFQCDYNRLSAQSATRRSLLAAASMLETGTTRQQ